MVVTFKDALVLDVLTGTSQKGNQYAKLRFLSDDMQVYDIFFSPDDVPSVASLQPKQKLDLKFNIVPGYRGGVRLQVAW